jgi:5-methylcytosine-specific restriction endonuclease McrA
MNMVSEKELNAVWEKAAPIKGENPNVYKKDSFGNVIRKQSYGTKGEYSWEIDHIKPTSKGGSNTLRNKQPLHREENRAKSNKYPYKKGK